jgi:hypothetical protein
MKTLLLTLLTGALLCSIAAVTSANPISSSWGLHWAGSHDPVTHNCGFYVTDCATRPKGQVVISAPATPGHYDLYVLIVQSTGVKETRFGLCCQGAIDIVGWTSCADFEFPSPGWPGCSEGDSLGWAVQKSGNVTLGILEVEVYGSAASVCVCPDPRVGYAGMCYEDGPELLCEQHMAPSLFGCVGFGMEGYNACDYVSTDRNTWGLMKALYR